ncbi:hypothetical protein [Asticcacaulis sp. 201]|uniref:hypothetical protein n=1 Tax=Asticcacaulis sp. 201 TaxID=3028787 RepID=UPI0029169012|nr:hypothetical protein [Asticcacaulis sp. 201]MDV6329974.1 hypothetical protein [Asticcacaulis sp. 201]
MQDWPFTAFFKLATSNEGKAVFFWLSCAFLLALAVPVAFILRKTRHSLVLREPFFCTWLWLISIFSGAQYGFIGILQGDLAKDFVPWIGLILGFSLPAGVLLVAGLQKRVLVTEDQIIVFYLLRQHMRIQWKDVTSIRRSNNSVQIVCSRGNKEFRLASINLSWANVVEFLNLAQLKGINLFGFEMASNNP